MTDNVAQPAKFKLEKIWTPKSEVKQRRDGTYAVVVKNNAENSAVSFWVGVAVLGIMSAVAEFLKRGGEDLLGERTGSR